MPAAIWTETAIAISATVAVRDGYRDLDQVVDETGLAAATIRDALSRPKVDNDTVPLGALARPAARIGGVASPSPQWHPDQLAEYKRRRVALSENGVTTPDLPEVTAAEAEARGLASIEQLAEALEVAPNTLRRWARTFPGFPAEIAMALREPPHHRGRQHRLRDRAEVARWVLDHTTPEPEQRVDFFDSTFTAAR